jgi:hypothetical protein
LISHRVRFLVVLVALGAASFGVSVAQAKKGQSKGQGKGKAAPAATEDCKVDSDCVLVSEDCCSCSQGGKQRAIPKKQKSAYEKDLKKRCADTACTEAVSTDPSCSQQPICGAGICELGG